jgi:hypothetical protein
LSNASAARPAGTSQRDDYLHDDLKAEYYKIVDIVIGFDQRLLTIKGWGVTFSLATIALGFQQNHYGLFLVAAASGVAFWLVEGSTKAHQMRYYPRMRAIEMAAYELYRIPKGSVSSPLIDWSWSQDSSQAPQRREGKDCRPGIRVLIFPHVLFPHVVSSALGAVLFYLGVRGVFGPI